MQPTTPTTKPFTAILLVLAALLPRAAAAQPATAAAEAAADARTDDVDELVEPAPPSRASYQADRRRSRSYLVPALEIVGVNLAANAGARLAGEPWAEVTPSTMWRNLRREWVYDADLFSVNQLAHPYGGALLYSAARSSGHGFWTSTAYDFAGSLVWETLMENEEPSLNDQLTTTVAGAFLGEALHRFGRAVRLGGGDDPSLGRRVLAAVIDPAGAANAAAFGERWRAAPPPRLHAQVATGYARGVSGLAPGPLHLELAVAHGLPSDPRFVPRAPFHHFDLRGQLDVGADGATGYLDIRGLLVGDAAGSPRRRALWGIYGTYDYWDAQAVRASAFGVGPGIAAHATLGERGFVEATGVLALVPWGAGGGTGDVEYVRDYRHGPGAAQHVELKLGRTGLGVARLAARAIEIEGDLVGDANEVVVVTSGGVMAALAANHALGAEVVYSARSTRFADAAMNALDQAAQVRVMYAVTSDRAFGGPSD